MRFVVIGPISRIPDERLAGRVIIVGSGPVGIALARALARRGLRSCVLEAGGTLPQLDLAADLSSCDMASFLRGAVEGRTRQIGGGLNLWGGQLALPHDCEQGPTGDAPTGWPFDLAVLRSRTLAATELLGQRLRLDIAGRREFGDVRSGLARHGMDLVSTAWLRVPKLPSALWTEIAKSDSIILAHSAFVEAFAVDASGAVAGVRLRDADGAPRHLAGGPIVVAAGTIETVRLLLQPVDGKPAPWAELDWLGRGFNEHLEAAVATVAPGNRRTLLDVFDPALSGGVRYSCKTFFQAPAATDRPAPLSAVGMLTLPGNVRNAIAELKMLLAGLTPRSLAADLGGIGGAVLAAGRDTLPLAWRYLRHKRIGTILRGEGTLRVSLEQPVRRESRLWLGEDRDSRGTRKICTHWIKGEAEGLLFLSKAERIKAWADASGAAKVTIDPLLLTDPVGFAAAADDGLHHAGGARMAVNRADGVVDINLAVFDTRNLYCCGAAVFPRLGYGNPTLTAVVLADRLAEHLAREHT